MPKYYTLSEIAQHVGGQVEGDEHLQIAGLSTLESAQPGSLSFLANPRYAKYLKSTDATAVLVAETLEPPKADVAYIRVPNPYLAYAKASALFDWRDDVTPHVATSAVIHCEASVAPTAFIAAGAVIGAGSSIGEGVYVGPNATIGRYCHVGSGTRLEAGVVLYDHVSVGDRCLIHSNAVLGADGFGFAPSVNGWEKIHQLGGVRIGHGVEIGANTTIDRGALSDTVVEDGAIIDNLVQIAHNVVIGEKTAIAGCTGIAGSTKIGARSTLAGGVGVAGHLVLAEKTHVTAMSLVSRSVTEPGQVVSSGTGQEGHTSWKRNVVRFKQLDSMAKRIALLEQKVENISS